MGRGRAKAKQTKVARELKYSSPSTDFASLQRELSNGTDLHHHRPSGGRVLSDEDESLSRWNSEDDDYDDWRR